MATNGISERPREDGGFFISPLRGDGGFFISPLREHMTADEVLRVWQETAAKLEITRRGYEIESPYQRRPLKAAPRQR